MDGRHYIIWNTTSCKYYGHVTDNAFSLQYFRFIPAGAIEEYEGGVVIVVSFVFFNNSFC
jgi:hypothetical protein